ncbi:MAG TPA: hypothetical protein VHO24_15465 [Opitutaceae bacterium]|nr:hypothetical protein [Opitutaceae bacterium]
MTRTLFSTAFIAVLALLTWVFAKSSSPGATVGTPRPVATGEKLWIVNLRPSERVAIVFRSTGCEHEIERLYQIQGGETLRFAAKDLKPDPAAGASADEPLLGKLNEAEAAGLDSYLVFLRHGFPGGCTSIDSVVVGYYRDGKKIGEERFQDGSCLLSGFRWEKGKVVAPEQDFGSRFPRETYRSIVPPRLIEERLLKASPASGIQPGTATGQ